MASKAKASKGSVAIISGDKATNQGQQLERQYGITLKARNTTVSAVQSLPRDDRSMKMC